MFSKQACLVFRSLNTISLGSDTYVRKIGLTWNAELYVGNNPR